MKPLIPYLNFDGNTREAMTFYRDCFGGELEIQSFADVGMTEDGQGDRTMHARVVHGSAQLMASDSMPGQPFNAGNNMHITIDCENEAQQSRLFDALASGGQVTMALNDTFWGARFGMLVDRFGVQWMLNYDRPTA